MPSPLRKLARTVKTQGPQLRTFRFDRATANEEARTVELSFSSETRDVVRWFGIEVLGHGPGEVRLDRINTGGPVLVDHNGDQVGVVERAWIDESARKGRAIVRFSRSERGEEVFRDVLDDIRRNVSFAYEVYRYVLEEEGRNGAQDVLRAVDWEPLEISIVSMPADISVGVGRSRDFAPREIEIYAAVPDTEPIEQNQGGNKVMNCEKCGKPMAECTCGRSHAAGGPPATVTFAPDQERAAERKRIQEIQAMAAPFRGKVSGVEELETQFIENGRSVAEFSQAVLDKMGARGVEAPQPVAFTFNEREQNEYSVLRAISMAAGLRDMSGIEYDIHQEIVRKLNGRATKGLYVPMQLRASQRAPLTTSTSGAGAGYSVATEVRDMIELLRAKMLVRQLGAQVLSGLTSSVAFPRQTGSATLYWTGENPGSDVAESNATLDQVILTPKTAQATTQYSRQLLQQSSIDVENFVRNDLTAAGALGLDAAAIAGTGSANQPRGILSTSGIGSVAGGANGALPTYANMVALEAAVATANADVGALGYLTTTKARGILKTTPRFTGVDTPIWTDGPDGFGMVNGYRAGATTQVPSNLVKGTSGAVCSAIIFGNWNDLLIGEFGVMEIIADPYAKKKQGLIEVTSLMMCDITVRHPASFAAMVDALTTGF